VAWSKYISPPNLMAWIGQSQRLHTGVSIIWKAVIKSLDIIRVGITWKIQSGMKVRIVLDPWIRCGNIYRLPDDPKSFLIDRNITHIGHIAEFERSTPFQQAWKTDPRLNIPHQWTQ